MRSTPSTKSQPYFKIINGALRYRDEHNTVGYLQKPTGSDDYHQILDFLRASHIRYALTNDLIIFDSLVKQFWSTATLSSCEFGPLAILATIDETPYTITEDLVRSQLQLVNDGGIDDLPIAEIYYGIDNLGYVTEGKLTFYKNKFSPQWRFLVHTILHCLSTKSGSWDQFGSSLAVALICLSNGRKFNWSDQSTKHFTTLREILHMVDRHDLLKLYGMVVTYYENHLIAGAGLMLWGDLQVLMDSQEGGKGSFVWNNQSLWQIRSWRLYTLSNVHVLETVSREVLYMFVDVSYPLSVKLMERMLKHKLEIDKDVVGNDMTNAEQLIWFIKNQIVAAQVSPV
ncbi:hypothetical protein Tco_0871498 [Tanacetum coccineum]